MSSIETPYFGFHFSCLSTLATSTNSSQSKCISHLKTASFCTLFYLLGTQNDLVKAESAGASLLDGLLLLAALLEGCDRGMVSAEVVQVLDLVNANDPVFTGKSFLDRVKDGALGGNTGTADSVGRLSWGEEAGEVVVRHLVPAMLLAF